jgi:hypothetical protein
MIIPDDHAHLVTEYTAPNHSEILSFTMGCYVDDTGVGGPDDAADIAERFSQIWETNCKTLCANEYTIGTTTAYWRQGADLLVGVSSNAPYVGGLGVGAEPPAVSWLIRKNTGLAGRKFRGRMFAPQPRHDDVDGGGNVLPAQIANWAVAGAAVLSSMADAGVFGWSMAARILHSDATAPTPIVALVCDPVVGTQRRRQR